MTKPTVSADPRPFERAIFDALTFSGSQVQKVDVSIGPRTQSVTFKFGLTPEQVALLDAMTNQLVKPADEPAEAAWTPDDPSEAE